MAQCLSEGVLGVCRSSMTASSLLISIDGKYTFCRGHGVSFEHFQPDGLSSSSSTRSDAPTDHVFIRQFRSFDEKRAVFDSPTWVLSLLACLGSLALLARF